MRSRLQAFAIVGWRRLSKRQYHSTKNFHEPVALLSLSLLHNEKNSSLEISLPLAPENYSWYGLAIRWDDLKVGQFYRGGFCLICYEVDRINLLTDIHEAAKEYAVESGVNLTTESLDVILETVPLSCLNKYGIFSVVWLPAIGCSEPPCLIIDEQDWDRIDS